MKKEERRRKVVIRKLPAPAPSPSPAPAPYNVFKFEEVIMMIMNNKDPLLAYNWLCFRPPPNSSSSSSSSHKKNHTSYSYSRAYIEFKKPVDVSRLSQLFNAHFNFNAIVEYAPSQRVPKPSPIKDVLQDTIFTDPHYLEFLKLVAKPVDNVSSHNEAQSSSSAAASKQPPITTPLMELVCCKPAAEAQNQGSLVAVKGNKRVVSASVIKPGSSANKRHSGKKNSAKNSNQKNKLISPTAPRQEDHPATLSGKVKPAIQSDSGKKEILVHKGKHPEISAVSGGMLQQPGHSPVSTAPKQSKRFRACERIIKDILSNNEAHDNQCLSAKQHRHKIRNLNMEHKKQSPWSMNKHENFNGYALGGEPSAPSSDGGTKRTSGGKFLTKSRYSLGSPSAKQEKSKKEKTDCSVQAPVFNAIIQGSSEEKLSSTVLQQTGLNSDSIKGSCNHLGRNGSLIASGQKSFKRGGASGYAIQEKQVWVQKSATGS